jgi:hypothetical protein
MAEIKRMAVRGPPWQIICEIPTSKITKAKQTGGVAQGVECKCEGQSPNPHPTKKKKRDKKWKGMSGKCKSGNSNIVSQCFGETLTTSLCISVFRIIIPIWAMLGVIDPPWTHCHLWSVPQLRKYKEPDKNHNFESSSVCGKQKMFLSLPSCFSLLYPVLLK